MDLRHTHAHTPRKHTRSLTTHTSSHTHTHAHARTHKHAHTHTHTHAHTQTLGKPSSTHSWVEAGLGRLSAVDRRSHQRRANTSCRRHTHTHRYTHREITHTHNQDTITWDMTTPLPMYLPSTRGLSQNTWTTHISTGGRRGGACYYAHFSHSWPARGGERC